VAWVFVQSLKIIVPVVDCTTFFLGVCGGPKGAIYMYVRIEYVAVKKAIVYSSQEM
jgi:hypothetical protein